MALADMLGGSALTPEEKKQMEMMAVLGAISGALKNVGRSTDPNQRYAGVRAMGDSIAGMMQGGQGGLAQIMQGQKIAQMRKDQERQAKMQEALGKVPTTTLTPTAIPNWNVDPVLESPLRPTTGVQYSPEEMNSAAQMMKEQNPQAFKEQFNARETPRSLAEVLSESASAAMPYDIEHAAKLATAGAALEKAQRGPSSDNQIVEIADPSNPKKNIKALVDKGTGKVITKVGDVLETFKPKNLLGRGWVTKRPIMQSNETGQAVYEDTGEPVPPEDKAMLRPLTLKGLAPQQASELAGLKNTYDRLEDVAVKAEKMKDKFGPLSGRWNALRLKFINDGPTQEVQNELRSMITIAYGLSGKQISIQEMQMLQDALLPALTQPFENFGATLKFAKDWVGKTHDDRLDYFEQSGFDSTVPKLIKEKKESKGRSVVKTGKDKSGRKVVQYSDGSIEYAE